MIKYIISFLLLAPTAVWAQYKPGLLVLTNATIIDADHRVPLPRQTVFIRDGKISLTFTAGEHAIPDSAMVINLEGKSLLPGLVDSHVHMATDPSGVDNRARTLDVLKRMLYSGVTCVRDMAGDGRVLAGLARDARLEEITSPDIYYSALMAGSVFFSDPRTATSTRGGINGKMPYMQAISDSTNFTLAIAEAKGSGASGIKLYANLTTGQVNRIMTEAQKQQMPVWGHAWLQGTGPSDLVRAGLISISHAPLLVREKTQIPEAWKKAGHNAAYWDQVTPDLHGLFDLMRAHHTILDATLLTYKVWASQDSAAIWDYEIGKRIVAQAYRAGITICAGTDDDQEKFVQEEMRLLVTDADFSPIDAIIAATQNSAAAIGLQGRKGLVKAGMDADLIVLDADPLASIDNITKVKLVIKGGRIYNR